MFVKTSWYRLDNADQGIMFTHLRQRNLQFIKGIFRDSSRRRLGAKSSGADPPFYLSCKVQHGVGKVVICFLIWIDDVETDGSMQLARILTVRPRRSLFSSQVVYTPLHTCLWRWQIKDFQARIRSDNTVQTLERADMPFRR